MSDQFNFSTPIDQRHLNLRNHIVDIAHIPTVTLNQDQFLDAGFTILKEKSSHGHKPRDSNYKIQAMAMNSPLVV